MTTKRITIETTVQETKTVDLIIPCFFRDLKEQDYIGLLDEDTVVTIYRNSDLLQIQNSKLWLKKNDLVNAYHNFTSCTETEFFDAYADVEQKMSLHPILAR